MPAALVVIPARFASTRLAGKALLAETGRPLVVHTVERAAAARRVKRVVVATDDHRILEAVRHHGHEAVLTRADHASGTDRVAEVARGADEAIVVNLQGDEPEVDPDLIDALVGVLSERPGVDIATAAVPFPRPQDAEDPDAVKVVVDRAGKAIYFSRARIPYPRGEDSPPPRLHVGLYAFHRAALIRFSELAPSRLERAERLEQLRALENDMTVHVVDWPRGHAGIDTPEDYRRFVERRGAGRPTTEPQGESE